MYIFRLLFLRSYLTFLVFQISEDFVFMSVDPTRSIPKTKLIDSDPLPSSTGKSHSASEDETIDVEAANIVEAEATTEKVVNINSESEGEAKVVSCESSSSDEEPVLEKVQSSVPARTFGLGSLPFSSIQACTRKSGSDKFPGFQIQQTSTHLSLLFDVPNVVSDSVVVDLEGETAGPIHVSYARHSFNNSKVMGHFSSGPLGVLNSEDAKSGDTGRVSFTCNSSLDTLKVTMWKFRLELENQVLRSFKRIVTSTGRLLLVFRKVHDELWNETSVRWTED